MTPKDRPRSRSDAGFTLAEALIATLVLTFGLASIFNLMIVSTTSNSVANQSSAATMLASQQLEFFRSQPFGVPPALNPVLAASPAGVDTLDVQTPGFFANGTTDPRQNVAGVGAFETRWLIQNVNATSLFITVRTEALGFRGRQTRAEFTTIRTSR